MKPYNHPESIIYWATDAIKGVADLAIRTTLMDQAKRLAAGGHLRGDISDAWKKHPVVYGLIAAGQIKNLYN
jgi:hypothetical protein